MVNHPTFGVSRSRSVVLISLCLTLGPVRGDAQEAQPRSNSASAGATSVLRASVNLRPAFERWGLTNRAQGKRDTCSVFTVAGALEFATARQRGQGERLSVEFLNWAANRIAGEDKDGGFFSDLCQAFAVYGICSETSMPYAGGFDPALAPTAQALAEAKSRLALGLRAHWIKKWDVKTGLTETQFVAIRRTLSQGWPVCAGCRWPKEPRWSDNVLQMCPTDAVYDGHSVLLVGYRDDTNQPGGGVFLFRNTGNGSGDGSMPYAYGRTYMNDAVWISSNTAGPPGFR